MITRPLLAQELENLEDVIFPVLVSAKLDGIRCLKVNGKVLSRSFKEIPNNYIRTYLEANAIDGMDGEILTYTDGKMDDFNIVQSKVMSEEGEPVFIFAVFDFVEKSLTEPYKDRYTRLTSFFFADKIVPVDHTLVYDLKTLKKLEDEWVAGGYEGIMVRHPDGKYKCGRSTLNEGILLKFKRFEDSEAEILEILEQDKNIGAKGINELGKTKRSHKKADKAPAGTMGEMRVRDLVTGKEFHIGTGIGLTKEFRQHMWDNKDQYIGKYIKYKHQGCGAKDLPRFPSFQGIRDPKDMS